MNLRRLGIGLLLAGLLALVVNAGPVSQHGARYFASSSSSSSSSSGGGTLLFQADFSNPNANGTNFFNFANKLGTSDNGEVVDGQQNWSFAALPTGGYGGAPGVRLTELANRYQYPMGWDSPALSWSPTNPDEIYYRFKIRIDDNVLFTDGMPNKLIDHGSTTGRNIIWLYTNYDYDGGGGVLGWAGAFGPSDGDGSHATPAYFGLSGTSWSSGTHADKYGSITVSHGVGIRAAEPALITNGNRSSPPAPGPNSAAPVSGWYHVQVMARSGNSNPTAPISRYFIWINNNDQNNPTAVQYSWNEGIEPDSGVSTNGWTNGFRFGGYAGDQPGPSADFSFVISHLEVSTDFKSDWYPPGG